MRYLIIDNCSLRDLIDIHGYSKYLDVLENSISARQLCFLTHEVIIEEWNKHKPSYKKEKTKKLLNSNKSSNDITNQQALLVPCRNDHIDRQFEKIDELLKSANILQTPPIINDEFALRYKKKLAPFHKKSNSQNDWEIIGTAGHYCEKNAIEELYFISANSTDFANPIDNEKIHEEIKERFTNLKIHYYSDYKKFFDELSDINIAPVDIASFRILPNVKFTYKSTIRKNSIDALCYIFKELYSEIQFIPLHILTKLYPFSESEESYTYYNQFNVHEVSGDLINTLENITIAKDKIYIKNETVFSGITDYKEKIEFGIRRLNQNLIFHLHGEKRTKRICTHIEVNQICNCIACYYNRFEFFSCFNMLKISSSNYNEMLKTAYINYKVGNYRSACAIYNDIIHSAHRDKQYITFFIAKYNLRHLASFMSNLITNSKIDYSLIKELKEIDPIEEAIKLKGLSDFNLLSFICQEDYFSDAFQNVTNAANNIIGAYYSQLNGGWSHNSYDVELIEEFTKVEAFLNLNNIIYDQYSNFDKLFDRVVEGLFASNAISDGTSSRFDEFDDYWAKKFVEYGKHENIIKYFRRYNLKELKYTQTNSTGNSFFNFFRNLMASKKPLQGVFKEQADEGNFYFDLHYEKLVENSITVLSILKLSKKEVNNFSGILITYLKEQSNIQHSLYKTLTFFIEKKGNSLNSKAKIKLLKLFFENESDCTKEILFDLLDKFSTTDILLIPKKTVNALLMKSLNKCSKCMRFHDLRAVTKFYEKGDNVLKKMISAKVKTSLQNEWVFEVFYLATIFGILKIDKNKLIELVRSVKGRKNGTSNHPFFSRANEFQNSYFDDLLNLCFKYNVDTTTRDFKIVASAHPCYKWLLNMDTFNYEKFDPLWVLRYRYKYFYKQMSKSEKTKIALRTFLKEQYHTGVERVLLRITNFT